MAKQASHTGGRAPATHHEHPHKHGPTCGHVAVHHEGHVDHLHDGHLHHSVGDTVHEHVIVESASNPVNCTPDHECKGHAKDHRHGPQCGHHSVPHGNHMDYLVDGHLHHPHGAHCDDHGALKTA